MPAISLGDDRTALTLVDDTGRVARILRFAGMFDLLTSASDMVAISSTDSVPSERGSLTMFRMDAEQPKWEVRLRNLRLPRGREYRRVIPRVDDDRVLAYSDGVLISLDANSGRVISTKDLGSRVKSLRSDAVLVPIRDALIVLMREQVVCLERDLSRKRWEYRVNLSGNIMPSPVVHDDDLLLFTGKPD